MELAANLLGPTARRVRKERKIRMRLSWLELRSNRGNLGHTKGFEGRIWFPEAQRVSILRFEKGHREKNT